MNRPSLLPSRTAVAAASLLFGLAAATPAHAWEWGGDEMQPTWRPESLTWAKNIALQVNQEQISTNQLQSSYAPPPREHWCVENPAPTPADCAVAANRLNNWIADFLDLGSQDPIPEGLAQFPKECSSICQL